MQRQGLLFAPVTDRLLRIVGPVVLLLTGALFFRLKMYLEVPAHLLLNQVGIALGAGYLCWELTRFTALLTQRLYPGLSYFRRRVLILAGALIVLSHFAIFIRWIAHIILDGMPWNWLPLMDYFSVMGVLIFYTIVTLGLYEGAYLLQQWKQTFAEKEQLIQSQWQTRYDLLKTQINPHFLFNSLNTLSALIAENPQQAEQFADEMSRVYRYLLRSSDQELVSLNEELDFIRSYGELLNIRYGNGFRLNMDVGSSLREYVLPPMTLQLLVENAVKHNAVTKEKPLTVTITGCGKDRLCVKNNIQKKRTPSLSTGLGLKNINAKFRMLGENELLVEATEHQFTVTIPLIPAA